MWSEKMMENDTTGEIEHAELWVEGFQVDQQGAF